MHIHTSTHIQVHIHANNMHTCAHTHTHSAQTDPIGTIVYSLVVRDRDEGTNSEISFALTSPVSSNIVAMYKCEFLLTNMWYVGSVQYS